MEGEKKLKYGWISQKSISDGNNIYIYQKLDSDEEVQVSTISSEMNNSECKFSDIKLVGPVGDYIRTIKGSGLWNIMK